MTWRNPPTKFKKQVRGDLLGTAKLVTLKVLRGVVFGSPVSTGRFRGNWIVGLGRRTLRQLKTFDKGGGGTFDNGKKQVDRAKLGKSIFVTNNLPYAKRLNEGWSQQAPANFVQSAIRRALK